MVFSLCNALTAGLHCFRSVRAGLHPFQLEDAFIEHRLRKVLIIHKGLEDFPPVALHVGLDFRVQHQIARKAPEVFDSAFD